VIDGQVLGLFLTMAVATFLTRALPFVALRAVADHPMTRRVGLVLPPMIMVVLVSYGVLAMPLDSPTNQVACGVGVLTTVLAHVLLRHVLVSMVLGTGPYMVMVTMGI